MNLQTYLRQELATNGTMLKSTYAKMETNVLKESCFKNFLEQSFLQYLKQELGNTGNFVDASYSYACFF